MPFQYKDLNMLIQVLLLITSFYCYTIAPVTMDRTFMAYMIVVAFGSILNCYCIKENNYYIKGQHFRHSFVFLLGYIIVFYQYIIDYVLYYIEKPEDVPSLIWYDQTVVCQSLCLANVGLNSFLLGYLWVKKRYNPYKHIRGSYKEVLEFPNLRYLLIACWLLIIAYIVIVDKSYLFNGYGKNAHMGEMAYHIYIWIQGVLSAYIIVKSYVLKRERTVLDFKKYLVLFGGPLILSLIMVALILMSGRRTEALRFILLLLISYLYMRGGKMSLLKILIPAILVTTFFSLLLYIRISNNTTLSDSLKILQQSSTISPITQELAFNISSLHIALANVPSIYPHLLGLSTIVGVSALVPGLQPFLVKIVDVPVIFSNSTNLICYAALGEVRYYTLGTSLLADIYINFGVIGIVIFPIFLGVLIRKLEHITFTPQKPNIYFMGVSFCIYAQLIYFSRATLTAPLTSISYVLIILFLFSKKTSKK